MQVDFERLKRKGWSHAEVDHAKRVMQKAESAKHPYVKLHEHSLLWLLTVVSLAGISGILFLIYPVIALFDAVLSSAIVLLCGLLLGLLIAYALKSLRAQPHHHVLAMSMLVLLGLATSTITLGLLAREFGGSNTLLFSTVFMAGMMIPYLVERRLHGSS